MNTVTVSLNNSAERKNILSSALNDVLARESVHLTTEMFDKITNITDIDTDACAITVVTNRDSACSILLLAEHDDNYTPADFRTKEEGRVIFGDITFGKEVQYRSYFAYWVSFEDPGNLMDEDYEVEHGTFDENQPFAVLIKKYDVEKSAFVDNFDEDEDIVITTSIYIYVPEGYKPDKT